MKVTFNTDVSFTDAGVAKAAKAGESFEIGDAAAAELINKQACTEHKAPEPAKVKAEVEDWLNEPKVEQKAKQKHSNKAHSSAPENK